MSIKMRYSKNVSLQKITDTHRKATIKETSYEEAVRDNRCQTTSRSLSVGNSFKCKWVKLLSQKMQASEMSWCHPDVRLQNKS